MGTNQIQLQKKMEISTDYSINILNPNQPY